MVRQSAGLIVGLAACSGAPSDSDNLDFETPEPSLYIGIGDGSPPKEYRSKDGVLIRLNSDKQQLIARHGSWSTRLRWGSWGILGDCVGDPMSPHSADPESLLAFRDTPQGEWVVRYSGLNDCGIEGEAVLSAHRDRVDVSRLYVGGTPWNQGGRQHVDSLLKIQLREEAVERYQAAGSAERILLLKRLSEDPEATEALASLAEKFPLDRDAIEQAKLQGIEAPKPLSNVD